MSTYKKILNQFVKLGFNQNSKLDERQVNAAMDKICSTNIGEVQFNRFVAGELWQHANRTGSPNITLRDYIDTIIEGQKALMTNINATQNQLETVTDPQRKQNLLDELHQFRQDYKLLSQPFTLGKLPPSRALSNSQAQGQHRNNISNASGIFQEAPSSREQSTSLKLVFIAVLLAFPFELILMFHKDHFFNSLVYISILAIFLLNYFDMHYIRYCLGSIFLSIVLDIVWLIVHSDNYWNPYAPTMHSTLQTGILRFIYAFTVILLLLKMLIGILLFRYRGNDEYMKKSVKIFNLKFDLDGRIVGSPLSLLMAGRPPRAAPQENN